MQLQIHNKDAINATMATTPIDFIGAPLFGVATVGDAVIAVGAAVGDTVGLDMQVLQSPSMTEFLTQIWGAVR